MRFVSVVGAACAFAFIPSFSQAFEIEMREPVVVAKVDKAAQRMTVYVNGEKKYHWKVSTGLLRYNTPNGTHTPYRMHKMWHSRKYQMAPMPYAVFYRGGYAVHGTAAVWRLGKPASHGCVRLKTANARKFYELVREHGRQLTTVTVAGEYKWSRTARRRARKPRRSRYTTYQRSYRSRYERRAENSRFFSNLFR